MEGESKSKEFHISIKTSVEEEELEQEESDITDEQGNWTNIIYLPFQPYWNYIIVSTTIFNFGMNSMDFVFELKDTFVHTFIYYFCELLYLIHTVAQLIHKRMVTLRKRRYYQPVSTPILCLSIISLFPYFEVYYLLNVYTWDYTQPMDKTRIKVVLRLLPVFAYFANKKRDVGVRQIVVVVLNQILIMSLIVTCLSCTWYQMGDYTSQADWTLYLKPYSFSPNNTVHWMILCAHVTGTFLTHGVIGRIFGVTTIEKVFLLLIIFWGFSMIFMIFFAELTAAFIQSYWHHHEYTSRLKKIVYLLNDWGVNKEVRKKTIEYYTVFWERRLGMRDVPEAFDLLPISMRKDVVVDIFWDSFRHSHIFVGASMAVKRSISMVMKSDFLLPGDYLFKAGQLKAKMVYIVSGVVQVLTDEDNESPVLSFSAGTLLGETACLRAIVSQANLKCATYCDLHTLNMVDLYKVLMLDVQVGRYLLQCVGTRIANARTVRREVAGIRRALNLESQDTSIMRLKKQWRTLSSLQADKKQDRESNWKKLDKTFTSQYMDLIVLSQEVELKVQAICLSSKCPLVMDPNSSFRVFCQYFIIFAACMQFIIVPYVVFFQNSGSMQDTLFVLDVFYYLDIYIQLSTAIKFKDKLISNSRDILLYRLKEITFIVDIFSALPYSTLVSFFKQADYSMFWSLPRIIKIYKIFILINEKEKNLWTSNIYMRFVKYLALSMVLLYSSTCILFAVSCTEDACIEKSWFLANNYKKSTPSNNFFISYLYAVALYFGHGIVKDTGYLLLDIVVTTLVAYLGYFMYCFVLSELTASSVLQVKKVYAHQDEILVMKSIMKHRLVGAELYSRFVKILDFNWRYNEGAQIQGRNAIFNDASEKIKVEIVDERISSVLKEVPLFNIFSEELIKSISMHMRITILPAGTPLVEIGATVLSVYVILRGYCSMSSDLPGDRERRIVTTLKQGDLVAPIELLHRLNSVVLIVTTTAVEIMQMPFDTYGDILRSHRSDYYFIQKTLQEHLHLYNNLLQKKSCRLPELRSAKSTRGKIESFEYKIFEQKEIQSDHKQQFMKPFENKQWGFIRYLMLRRTIDTKNKFYICWEAVRIFVIVVDVIVTILSINVLEVYSENSDYIISVSRITAAIDIYIRLHCQYYKENGILVTHPLYTAKHYLQHSFVIDILGAAPMTLLGVSKLFGTSYDLQSKSTIRLIFRPLLLYRPLMALGYLERMQHWSKGSILMKLRYTLVIVVLLGICSNILLLFTCKYDQTKRKMNCSGENWISGSFLHEYLDNSYILFSQSLYFVVAIYGNALSGAYKAASMGEIRLFIAVVFFLFMLKTVMLAIFTSSTVGGNINLSIYQARMKQFLKFAKEVKLDRSLIKETVAHNEYVWKETQGTSVMDVCGKLNLYLRIKFVCFLYEDTLRSTSLFVNLSPHSLRRLALRLEEVQFKKDAQIIRCNDVQTKLYIVYKGQVEVAVANVVISTLEVGGIFGCFSKTGVLRQTSSFTAKVHTIVLTIDSKEFHKVMMPWENEQARNVMRDIRLLKLEYLEPFVNTRDLTTSYTKASGLSLCYQWLIVHVNSCINQESFWYWLWEYMLNVHFSVISSLFLLTHLCMTHTTNTSLIFLLFIHGMDVIYLSKIFFGFTLQYIDVNTGIVQRQPKKITLKYVKSWLWFDIFTCIPLEHVASLAGFTNYSNFGTLNRVLRYFYIVDYYNICSYKLNISKHLRWTYLIYRSLFYTQVMVNIWKFCACFDQHCVYLDMYNRKTVANNSLDSVLVAYTYIVNIFTSTGLRYVRPMSIGQLVVAMLLIFAIQYIIAMLGSGFVTLIIIENTILINYKYSIERLNNYLKSHHLSQAILNNTWAYLLQLWKIQRGEWMPMLIHSAPSYLRQDIMKSLYISHLETHFLFGQTHIDFLRQLVVHLERCIYFPGNYIVAQGDMDSTMYFIHKGEVGAYHNECNKDIQLTTLSANMCFGEAQGLQQIPYHMSFKAISTVEVLALRRSSWEYLLTWFPASYEELKRKSQNIGLTGEYRVQVEGQTAS